MKKEIPRTVCVIGLGYIGLPTAAVLAGAGYTIEGVEIREDVRQTINHGDVHIVEPGLNLLVEQAVTSGRLHVFAKPQPADAFIICVPTPFLKSKLADLRAVKKATQSIVPVLEKENLVILESTVPPGTTTNIVKPILEKSGLKAGRDFYLAHCPERVMPGRIMKEIIENARIVGGIDRRSALLARQLYASFVKGKILLTDATTAEMTKLTENTYRDVNVAFANELSRICHKLGINVWEVISYANEHPRVNILKPGPGVGGHCIAVDPWFIVSAAPEEAKLVKVARQVNDSMPDFVVQRVLEIVKDIKKPVVAVLGLTYKADVDDIRESPALAIAHKLNQAKRVIIRVCDPYVKKYTGLKMFSLRDAIGGADCVVLLVDHRQFREAKWSRLYATMRHTRVVDTRGILPATTNVIGMGLPRRSAPRNDK